MKRFLWLPLALSTTLISGCGGAIDENLKKVSDAIGSRDPVTGAREVNFTSEQSEIKQATAASNDIIKQARAKKIPYDNQLPQYPRVRNAFNRLRQVMHRKNLPWEVHLIGQDTWNAFTVGGGKVFLFTGLMKGKAAIQGDDELAVVLAHEMAHVTARHVSEQQGKMLMSNVLDKKTRSGLYQASFSTNQESEADKFSVIYMALAGYDPRASVRVWSRMASVHGSFSKNMMHTHPLNNQRAYNLQRYAQVAMQYYTPGRINPKANQILKCNVIWCNRANENQSGTSAFLETIMNSYMENERAKQEAIRRQQQLQGQ